MNHSRSSSSRLASRIQGIWPTKGRAFDKRRSQDNVDYAFHPGMAVAGSCGASLPRSLGHGGQQIWLLVRRPAWLPKAARKAPDVKRLRGRDSGSLHYESRSPTRISSPRSPEVLLVVVGAKGTGDGNVRRHNLKRAGDRSRLVVRAAITVERAHPVAGDGDGAAKCGCTGKLGGAIAK